jgi:hypothetical protein
MIPKSRFLVEPDHLARDTAVISIVDMSYYCHAHLGTVLFYEDDMLPILLGNIDILSKKVECTHHCPLPAAPP